MSKAIHSPPEGGDSLSECFERTGQLTKFSQTEYSDHRSCDNHDVLNGRQGLVREILLTFTRLLEKVFCRELNLRLHLELRAIGLKLNFAFRELLINKVPTATLRET
jgi:hypothetical protein